MEAGGNLLVLESKRCLNQARYTDCLGNDFCLAFNTWGKEADLARAVVVNSGAEDDRMNGIAICDGVFQATKYDCTGATRKNCATRRGIERAAVPIAGKNLTFAV